MYPSMAAMAVESEGSDNAGNRRMREEWRMDSESRTAVWPGVGVCAFGLVLNA